MTFRALFHHAATEDETAIDTQYVAQARTWFDSVWNTVARPLDATR